MLAALKEWIDRKGLRNPNGLQDMFGFKNYILLLSVFVGLTAGVAAVLLKFLTHSIRDFSFSQLTFPGAIWLYPALPAIGIFFCILFAKAVVRGRYERSLASVIQSVANGTSEIPSQKTWSHLLTSSISVGFGSSAGLEAPIALTGSALGANIGKLLRLGRESRTLLLACGGAGAIAAMFNCPVAGALFACEILLPEFSIPALVPLLLASATASVVSQLIYPIEPFVFQITSWNMALLPYYLILGASAGLVSAFVIRVSLSIQDQFKSLTNAWLRGLFGCMVLYMLFLIFPALQGEGYSFINALLENRPDELYSMSPLGFLFSDPWIFLGLLFFLVFLKAVASSIGMEAGGDGGIFAPSMFIGGFLGCFLARLIRMTDFVGSSSIVDSNFLAVGMGGVLAGVMHAPMTGIFLIAEITGGYRLFVPLMIVASLSCYICRKLCRYNVYKSQIVMNGGVPDVNEDAAALGGLTVGEMAEKNFVPVQQTDTLRMLLQAVMRSHRNIFPVLDYEERLVGIVTLDDIRGCLMNSELYDITLVFDVMKETGPILKDTDLLLDAMKLFENLPVWNIPVTKNGKYVGFVSKSGIFDRYRYLLRNKHELF